MRKFLRWLLNFVETRFPEKVTVTTENYLQLTKDLGDIAERVIQLEKNLRSDHNSIIALETDISDLSAMHRSRVNDMLILNTSLNALQESVKALKEGIVKGEIRPTLSSREQERQDFIEGRLNVRPSVTRKELEAAANKK